jgi:hypothetical protein
MSHTYRIMDSDKGRRVDLKKKKRSLEASKKRSNQTDEVIRLHAEISKLEAINKELRGRLEDTPVTIAIRPTYPNGGDGPIVHEYIVLQSATKKIRINK